MKTQIAMRSFYLEGEIEDGAITILRSEGDMSIEGYYTVAEVAKELSRSERRVRQLIANGDLRSVKIGQVNLIPVDSFEEYQSKEHPSRGWPKGKPRK